MKKVKLLFFFLLLLYWNYPVTGQSLPYCSDGSVSWDGVIFDILSNKCGNCHLSSSLGGFNIATYAGTLAGGNNCGPAVVPGLPFSSEIIDKTEWVTNGGTASCGGNMPPNGNTPLTAAEFNIINNWIIAGAPESCPDTLQIIFEVDMNCSGTSIRPPGITGPYWGWCAGCNEMEDPDGDDIWEITLDFDLSSGQDSIEYIYESGGFATGEFLVDDMQAGGDCAPVTDFMFFARRVIFLPGTDTFISNTYGSCEPCNQNCNDTLILTEDPQPGGNYQADDWIISSSTINIYSNSAVVFQSGDQYIELICPFNSSGEVDFLAEISDCDPNN